MMNELSKMIGSLVEVTVMIVIAIFASIVGYLSKVRKGQTFQMSAFIINMLVAILMAFFIDSLVASFVPNYNIKLEMAIMVVVGISANKIMELIETQGLDLLIKRLFGDVKK